MRWEEPDWACGQILSPLARSGLAGFPAHTHSEAHGLAWELWWDGGASCSGCLCLLGLALLGAA